MATAPHCRICLVTPPELASGGVAVDAFCEAFAAALSGGDVAAVILSNGPAGETPAPDLVERLRDAAHSADAALLLRDDAETAVRLKCDGVLVAAEPALIRAARKHVGPDGIVGADCGTSRHAAMVAGEAEPDFVLLDAGDPELLQWWASLMEVPCVAGGAVTLANAPALAATGAEFLAVNEAIWSHAEGPAMAVSAFNDICTR